MSEPFAFNPIDPAVRRDPYALYARGRELGSFRHEGLPVPLVSIFRYDDIQGMLREHELFSSEFAEISQPPPEIAALLERSEPSMLVVDPPRHTRLRSLVNKAFTPRIVRQLEPRLREVAHELLDDALDRVQEQGEVDLVEALTYPLPVIAIAEIIGVPVEDREQFKIWSDAAVRLLGQGFFSVPSVAEIQEQMAVRKEMDAYFSVLADARRREPRQDLLSGLVQAEHEGSKLSQAEMLTMLVVLLVAGNETTTSLIGNAVIELLAHPDELDRLRREPALLPRAIDEVLRFASPVQFDPRMATRDLEIAGTQVSRGDLVLGWIGSANRDERVFEAPERFDVGREKNPHMAFGFGIHHCLGHNLARLEAQVALEVLLGRTKSFERADDEPLPLHASPVFRGFRSLPVRLRAA